MIIQPLTKIEVTESTLKCGPGSVGYVILQGQHSSYNIWDTAILFSKMGKTGKDRLEVMCLKDTMVDHNKMRIAPKSKIILDTVALSEGLYPQLHPSDVGKKKPRYSILIDHTKFDQIKSEHKDTMNMPVWEFMSYISAMSAFIYAVFFGTTPYNMPNRHSGGGEGFDSFPEGMPDSTLLWLYFMRGLKRDTSDRSHAYETVYRDFFDHAENRMSYILYMRQAVVMMQDSMQVYMRRLDRRVRAEKASIRSILHYYQKHPADYKNTANRIKKGEFIPAGKGLISVPYPEPKPRARPRRV